MKEDHTSSPVVPKETNLMGDIRAIYSALAKGTKSEEELENSLPSDDKKQSDDPSPLKVKIKLNQQKKDTIFQDEEKNPKNQTLQTGKPCLLTLFPFPELAIQPVFQSIFSEDNQELGEEQLNSLKSELEKMRKSLKDFSLSLQNQIDKLESWKEKSDQKKTKKASNLEKLKDSKQRRKKKSQDDNDATYSDENSDKLKNDSGSEDEIDVVDIDDGTALELDSSVCGKSSIPLSERKKNLKGKRNRNKNLRDRNTKRARSKKNQDYSSDDAPPPPKLSSKTNFWADMEPYFSPFTEEDVKFCAAQALDNTDLSFVIPPLGKHYKEIWEEEEVEERFNPEPKQVPPQENPERMVACGDLTERILAALIEENLLPDSVSLEKRQKDTESTPPLKSSDETLSLPLLVPPTYDFSYVAMLSLEERIRLELQHIGLLDDSQIQAGTDQREDDEICTELRKLQEQLREQISANNVIRKKLSPLVMANIAQQEVKAKESIGNGNSEKAFLKMLRKIKKKNSS